MRYLGSQSGAGMPGIMVVCSAGSRVVGYGDVCLKKRKAEEEKTEEENKNDEENEENEEDGKDAKDEQDDLKKEESEQELMLLRGVC